MLASAYLPGKGQEEKRKKKEGGEWMNEGGGEYNTHFIRTTNNKGGCSKNMMICHSN